MKKSRGSIEIVTVVYEPEIMLLKLQARSLARFFREGDIARIHVIVNELSPEASYAAIARDVLPEYGELLRKVEIHPFTRLMRPHVATSGWRTQQSLKLLISRKISTPQYLLLDAKNHFVREVQLSDLVDSNGRIRSFRVSDHGALADYMRNCLLYFGFDPEMKPEFSLPATTPYVVDTILVREMLDLIEAREGIPFDDFFHAPQQNMTEFFLYFAFLLQRELVEKVYRFGPRNSVTLFTRWPDTLDKLIEALGRLQRKEIKCFGVHKNRLRVLTPEFAERIADVWLEAGLFETRPDALHYIESAQQAVVA